MNRAIVSVAAFLITLSIGIELAPRASSVATGGSLVTARWFTELKAAWAKAEADGVPLAIIVRQHGNVPAKGAVVIWRDQLFTCESPNVCHNDSKTFRLCVWPEPMPSVVAFSGCDEVVYRSELR